MQRGKRARKLLRSSDGTVPAAAMFQIDGAFIKNQSLDISRLADHPGPVIAGRPLQQVRVGAE